MGDSYLQTHGDSAAALVRPSLLSNSSRLLRGGGRSQASSAAADIYARGGDEGIFPDRQGSPTSTYLPTATITVSQYNRITVRDENRRNDGKPLNLSVSVFYYGKWESESLPECIIV